MLRIFCLATNFKLLKKYSLPVISYDCLCSTSLDLKDRVYVYLCVSHVAKNTTAIIFPYIIK
jgi:hypothetical protein